MPARPPDGHHVFPLTTIPEDNFCLGWKKIGCTAANPLLLHGMGKPLYTVENRIIGFAVKVDCFTCFVGKSGLLCVHFGKKWTFLPAFVKKVVIFACSLRVGVMFTGKMFRFLKEIFFYTCLQLYKHALPYCDIFCTSWCDLEACNQKNTDSLF